MSLHEVTVKNLKKDWWNNCIVVLVGITAEEMETDGSSQKEKTEQTDPEQVMDYMPLLHLAGV